MNVLEPFLVELPLVAVLRGIRPDEVIAVADELVEFGFRALEVPLNSPDPVASIRALQQHFEGSGKSVLIGAGTVLTTPAGGRGCRSWRTTDRRTQFRSGGCRLCDRAGVGVFAWRGDAVRGVRCPGRRSHGTENCSRRRCLGSKLRQGNPRCAAARDAAGSNRRDHAAEVAWVLGRWRERVRPGWRPLSGWRYATTSCGRKQQGLLRHVRKLPRALSRPLGVTTPRRCRQRVAIVDCASGGRLCCAQ